MGITDFFSAAWDTFSHPSPDAEAPPKGGVSTDTPASGTDEESSEEAEVNKQDASKGGESAQGHVPGTERDERAAVENEEAEEEEEEETVDPKVVLEEGTYAFPNQIGTNWEFGVVGDSIGWLGGCHDARLEI